VISPAGFSVLLPALLRRCQVTFGALHLAVISCMRPPSEWQELLLQALGSNHCVVADAGNRRYCVVAARPDGAAEREASARALTEWAGRVNARVGFVTVEHAVVDGVGEREVLRLGELALNRVLARRDEGGRRIERFAIGRAAPFADEGAGTYETRNVPEP
jgi:hypothetical protein